MRIYAEDVEQALKYLKDALGITVKFYQDSNEIKNNYKAFKMIAFVISVKSEQNRNLNIKPFDYNAEDLKNG